MNSVTCNEKLLVLLHGFPETAQSWTETATHLNTQGLRTYAINQRGNRLGAPPK